MAAVAAGNVAQLQQHSANSHANSAAEGSDVCAGCVTDFIAACNRQSSAHSTGSPMAPGSQLPSADGGQSFLQHSYGSPTSVSAAEPAHQPAVAAVANTTL